MRPPLLGLLAVICLTTATVAQDNWPRFRGPNADGVAPDNAGLPMTWTTINNVKWVADIPGWGWSCPIVWGERVFLTSVVSEEENVAPSKGLYLGEGVREPAQGVHHWMVYCFDLNTGKEIWKHRSSRRSAAGAAPSEEHLRRGNADYRWRAAVRAVWRFGAVLL